MVAKALRDRGYEVSVVTSSFGLKNSQKKPFFVDGIKVWRILHDYKFTHYAIDSQLHQLIRILYQYMDVINFLRIVKTFKPDIINWWHLGGLCKGLLAVPSDHRIPDVHFIEDVWMRELRDDIVGDYLGWDQFWKKKWGSTTFLRIICKITVPLLRYFIPFSLENLESDYACFVSEFQHQANSKARIKFKEKAVIYGGSPHDLFFSRRDWKEMAKERKPIRLLSCSAISLSRRLNILIEALELMDDKHIQNFTLTVIGKPPSDKDIPYYDKLQEKVLNGKLKHVVSFLGQIPFDQMPMVYKNHDLLVFPSCRPEGLPLCMIEAMMAGCCVVTSGSGGAAEVAAAADLPVFAQDDSQSLYQLLLRIESDRIWMAECASRGQTVAVNTFRFDRMVDEFETVLKKIVSYDK